MSARIDLNNTAGSASASQTLAPPKRGRGRPRKNPPPPAQPRPPDPDTPMVSGFAPGDMVWGKKLNHAAWPGLVYSAGGNGTGHEGQLLVSYFGDKAFAWCDAAELRPYEPYFPVAELYDDGGEDFDAAVEASLDEFSRRVEAALASAARPFASADFLASLHDLAADRMGFTNRVQAAVAKAHLRAFDAFRALPDPPQYTLELGLLAHVPLPLPSPKADTDAAAAAFTTPASSSRRGRKRKEELVKDDDSDEDWDPSKRVIHCPALEMMKTKRGGDDLTRRPYKSRRARSGGDSLCSFLEQIQMRKTRRGGADFTTRLHKSRRGCNGRDEITESSSYGGREITESLTSGDLHGDSNENIWSRCRIYDDRMPKLPKSVASLALCHGNTMLFACSGLAIERKVDCTKFLTSGSLARALNGAKEGRDNLKIEVRHEGYEVHQGDLAEYDTNFSIVTIRTFLDVYVVRGPEIQPCGRVLAVGRDKYGKLMSTTVILDGDLKPSEDNEDPTCKMAGVNAWEGGPLFTSEGNFVGMSLFFVGERACFISRGTILEWLDHTSVQWSKGFKGFRSRPIGQKSNNQQEGYIDVHGEEQFLDSMGYPRPPITRDDGMILVNTFEETFGDTYPDGVWCEFSKKASSNIGRYVVALASFNGEKRCFACTGFFIEWNGGTSILTSASLVRSSSDENKIDENLRIVVLLPKNRHGKGTLLHYSLHYNVALVSVKDYRAVRPAIVWPKWFFNTKVEAVGRCFKSGALMASSGSVVSWTGTLDCTYIIRSTIKITKAGIGGPLVNLDGEVVGMNFYDTRIGTPFLPWSIIDIILARFEEKSKSGEAGSDSDPSGVAFWKLDGDHTDRLNRWPVPVPGWCHPQDLDEDTSEDDDEFGGVYGYLHGEKIRLF